MEEEDEKDYSISETTMRRRCERSATTKSGAVANFSAAFWTQFNLRAKRMMSFKVVISAELIHRNVFGRVFREWLCGVAAAVYIFQRNEKLL